MKNLMLVAKSVIVVATELNAAFAEALSRQTPTLIHVAIELKKEFVQAVEETDIKETIREYTLVCELLGKVSIELGESVAKALTGKNFKKSSTKGSHKAEA